MGRRGIMCGGGELGYLNTPQSLDFYVGCTKQKYLTWYNPLRRNRERLDKCSLCKVCENTNKYLVMDCNYTMQV